MGMLLIMIFLLFIWIVWDSCKIEELKKKQNKKINLLYKKIKKLEKQSFYLCDYREIELLYEKIEKLEKQNCYLYDYMECIYEKIGRGVFDGYNEEKEG